MAKPAPAMALDRDPDGVFLPVGRATPEKAPRELAELVARAWAAKLKADIATKAYDAVKNELKKVLVPGDMVTLPGLCKATLIPRETWSITNRERLEKVLGQARFSDLVDTTIRYTPTPKLVALQDDPAEDAREAIAACLTPVLTTAIDLREEKGGKHG